MKIIDIHKSLKRHSSKMYRKNEEVRYIIIHHTFQKSGGNLADFQALARYHVNQKDTPGIPYHYGVDPEGHIYRLLRHDLVRSYHIDAASKAIHSEWPNHILNKRAAARPSNHNSLGIVLPGNFNAHEVPQMQWSAAVELCQRLIQDHNAYIIGHRDVPGAERKNPEVDCPGIFFDMAQFVSEVRRKPIEDLVTPPHIRKYHSMIKKLKELGQEEMIPDLISLRRHIRYS